MPRVHNTPRAPLTPHDDPRFTAPCMLAFDHLNRKLMRKRQAAMKVAGEPWTFGLDPHEMVALAKACGLDVADHLSCLDCLRLYLPFRTDGRSVGVGSSFKSYMVTANALAAKELKH